MRRSAPGAFALAVLAAAPGLLDGLRAQAVTVDEGTFVVHIADRRAGSERFWIRRSSPSPDSRTIAQGIIELEVARGSRRMVAALEATGPQMDPWAYQIKISGTDRVEITGRLIGRRFSTKIVSGSGEEAVEYRAGPRARIVDRGVAHHHYFLVRLLDGDSLTVPMIVPRLGRQVSAAVTADGSERIRVGGSEVEARRIRVVDEEGEIRIIWVDGQGRVLRVEIPGEGYVAVRQALPS